MIYFFFFLGAVSATNHTVTPSDSIQSKIDGASAGDTLNLAAGTYNQYNIKVNKSLTISGPTTTGTPKAVINAQNQGRVFNTSGANVILKYLTITNGDATTGGGILNWGNCTIIGCKINSNTATTGGGGIFNSYGTCSVAGSNINSNSATATTGAGGGGIYNNYGTFNVVGSNVNCNTATYYGGGIFNSYGTFNVVGSNVNSNTATTGGGIYNGYGTFNVAGSNVNSNTATTGGGIYNIDGTFNVVGSNVNSNTATKYYGGGICNIGSTFNVVGSNVNSNTATTGGGIYNNYGTFNVVGSNVNSNTATTDGGGIFNYKSDLILNYTIMKFNTASFGGGLLIRDTGTATITGCDIESNKANTYGNAIYNDNGDTSTRVLRFNRFYDTVPGYEIFCASGGVDAMFNWWGSNDNPDSKVYGDVDTSPWLVLKLNASPILIGKNVKSNITADLRYDNIGNYHNPTNGYFPNNEPIQFSTTLGSITSPISTSSGTAKAFLTGGSTEGVADVFASLDEEIVGTAVNIETVSPIVTVIDPVNGAVNVPGNKVIKVTFSENIKNATGFVELKNSSGQSVPITVSISGKVLTINHAALVSGVYSLLLHTGCVADIAGNWLAGRGFSFTVDSTPPTVSSTDPVNNAVNVPRSKAITVTFSDNIVKRTDQIELKDSSGVLVPVTVSVSGKVLTINHGALLANQTYTVVLRTGCVADLAGNWLSPYTSKFTTGTT